MFIQFYILDSFVNTYLNQVYQYDLNNKNWTQYLQRKLSTFSLSLNYHCVVDLTAMLAPYQGVNIVDLTEGPDGKAILLGVIPDSWSKVLLFHLSFHTSVYLFIYIYRRYLLQTRNGKISSVSLYSKQMHIMSSMEMEQFLLLPLRDIMYPPFYFAARFL